MTKIIVILIIAAILENIGVVLIKGGIDQVNGPREINISEITRVIKSGFTNGRIVLGVALEAAFFGCFLYLLSQRDVSLVWPLTSIGCIVATLAAKIFLDEKISGMRWAGVTFIALGAFLISYSESAKDRQIPPPDSPALAAPPANAR